ncbi:OLC1v1002864C1 [Oldenlandia corymbosa var. corymbosa]|uniref:OLC1v1002864C1 n=1 Tax=Oldenlandia corymbosa var. corymbosa TaxID=529605 RepID=A0AAV1DC40_OLDCO|nr:OLC1v1002864C1 [Oldenlandia corymbosa var. corymbosa]
MATNSKQVLYDYSPLIKVYTDGSVERLMGTEIIPASVDPETGVQSKDVIISAELAVSARLYLPKNAEPGRKLPLLVYYHGGGFFSESAFSVTYHTHLNALVAEANVVAISVEYRLAPEHPLPAAYEDAWLALNWVASRSSTGEDGGGPEEWLTDYADFDRLFVGGDSAGGNIAHNMALKLGVEGLKGVRLEGMFLNCPFFWGKEAIGVETKNLPLKLNVDKFWHYVYPTTTGVDDPLANVVKEPKLASLGCKRVLVYVAEQDILKDRGWLYKQELEKGGWNGEIEIVEVEEEGHVFNLRFPKGEKSLSLLKKLASFINMHG